MDFFTGRHKRKILILLFWLALWQLGAWAVGSPILLAGPLHVIKTFPALILEKSFWLSIAATSAKISLGFLAAFLAGTAAGWLAFAFAPLQELLAPAVTFMHSVPLASFIILALIWTGSENLSVLTVCLVVFPIIYVNTIAGLKNADQELLEMAKVFCITGWRKAAGIYWPALLPYLASGCKTALGMSWKSGIAAEVIGVPAHTIGEQLYLAKIYLSTAELFVWTLVIILASALSAKVFLFLLMKTGRGRLLIPKYRAADGRRPSGRGHKTFNAAESSGFPIDSFSIDGLAKSFGSVKVFQNLNLRFSSRRPCCIMGPSGAGKTTLFRILLGLETPDAGSVIPEYRWSREDFFPGPLRGAHAAKQLISPCAPAHQKDGRNLAVCPASAVFQENRLCGNFSPVDNIRLAVPGLPPAEIAAELSQLLPAECLTRPVSTLSGGMKRRTAIARALLAPSRMVVMDEPFTGLDEKTKQDVIRYILKKRGGRLLILSTHQAEDLKLLDGELFRL